MHLLHLSEEGPLKPDCCQFHIRVGDLALLLLDFFLNPQGPLDSPHQGRESFGAGEPDSSSSKAAGITEAHEVWKRGRHKLSDVGWPELQILDQKDHCLEDLFEL